MTIDVTGSPFEVPPFRCALTVDKAQRRKPFLDIIRSVFSEAGEWLFRAAGVTLDNSTGLADDGIFVPPSELKKAKNDFYRFLEERFAAGLAAKVDQVASTQPSPAAARGAPGNPDLTLFSSRGSLSPTGGPIPFAQRGRAGIALESLAAVGGFTAVPLPPVMLDEVWWSGALAALVRAHPGTRFAVGLSNLAHLRLADALAADANAWFFVDFPFYVANRFTLDFLSRRVPRLLFAYSWIEDGEDGFAGAPGALPVLRVAPGFHPPLFYSLGCFAKHTLLSGRCPDEAARRRAPEGTPPGECPRDFSRELSQGRARFRVVVRDCVTYLFSVS